MTALGAGRDTLEMAVETGLSDLSFPMYQATTIYAGGLVMTNSTGYAVPVTAVGAGAKIWGRAEKTVVNTTAAGYGTSGDLNVTVKQGTFYFDGSGFTIGDVGKYCYAVDDNNVSLTDGAGLYPLCGVVYSVSSTLGIAVRVGHSTPFDTVDNAGSAAFTVRGVGDASNGTLATYTTAGDGITYVAGDQVLLYAQTAAAENGPYVFGTVASASAALTRPGWWPTGSTVKTGTVVRVGGEGTLFRNTEWKVCAASAAIVVGTDSAAIFPGRVNQQVTLNSGTLAVTNVPILSATKTCAIIDLITATSATSTFLYTASAFTASVTGSGTVALHAKEKAVTESTLDGSTLNLGIVNW